MRAFPINNTSGLAGYFLETFEESATVDPAQNGGEHWALGNGVENGGNTGLKVPVDCQILALGGTRDVGSFTIDVVRNGSPIVGSSLTVDSDAGNFVTIGSPIALASGDVIRPRTTAASGGVLVGTVSILFGVSAEIPVGSSIGTAVDVDLTGAAEDDILVRGADGIFRPQAAGLDSDAIVAIAEGLDTIALGTQLASDRQAARTTQFLSAPTRTGSDSGRVVSLANNNNIFVNGTFVGGFDRGGIYEYAAAQGDVVTSTKGVSAGYGITGNERPVEAASAAFAGRQFFWFAFRSSPHRHIVQALALESRVRVYGPNPTVNADGTSPDTPIQDQTIAAFGFLDFTTPTNGEYYILASQPVVVTTTNQALNQDQRVLAPLSNEIFGHNVGAGAGDARISALFANTNIEVRRSNGQVAVGVASPGSPLSLAGNDGGPDLGTDEDYGVDGWFIVRADGPIAGFVGADSAGTNATTFPPISIAAQVVGLPFGLNDNNANTNVALCSEFEGNVSLFDNTGTLLATRQIIRRGTLSSPATTATEQLHPASARFSVNEPDVPTVIAQGAFLIADVPIYVVGNFTEGNNSIAEDDEVSCFGITPDDIRSEIRQDANGLLRRRTIDGSGVETWVVC